MARARLRRRQTVPLAAALLAAAVGAWALFGGRGEDLLPDGGRRVASEPAGTGPMLAGNASPARAGAKAGEAAAEPALVGAEVRAPTETRVDLRLVDRRGRPLAFARVTLAVAVTDARGTWPWRNTAQADADGHVRLDLVSRRVLSVEVELVGSGQPTVVASFDGGEDAGVLAAGDLIAEGVEVLVAWTVDTRGNAVGDRRVVYRPRVPGVEPTGYWGDRSDPRGVLVLGPFATGSEVELRPGPRDSRPVTVADDEPWQRVRVDGTVARVNVGDAPRLRLHVLGVAADAEVPVNGRPERLQGGIWWGPEVHPRWGLDVVVGPLPDGRYARLESLYADEEPLDVELVAGQRVTGRLTGENLPDRLAGSVTARGQGWSASVTPGAGGAFVFPGLPDVRGVALDAVLEDPATGRPYLGSGTWSGAEHVEVRVEPAVVLRGRLHLDVGDAVPSHLDVTAWSRGGQSETRAQVEGDGSFRVTVTGGYVALEATVQLRGGRMAMGNLELEVTGDRNDLTIVARCWDEER